MKIAAVLVGFTLFMIIVSLRGSHGILGLEAIYGVTGVLFFAMVTKILSYILQREGLSDD